jgi:hypothetical protein
MQRIRRPFLAAVAFLLAACASTTVRDSWYDPEYRGTAFRTVEVWTGVTETFKPRSVARDAPAFLNTIVRALQSRGLLLTAR